MSNSRKRRVRIFDEIIRRPSGPTTRRSVGQAGFSLVEVSLAVLVVGLGLTVIFGLFPSSLRSSEEAAADTRTALFAEHVFGGLHAKASELTDFGDWAMPMFRDLVVTDIAPVRHTGIGTNDAAVKVTFPELPAEHLRYRLDITKKAELDITNRVHFVTLQVTTEQQGVFRPQATYYTELYYRGL